jgi:hypothetical protein
MEWIKVAYDGIQILNFMSTVIICEFHNQVHFCELTTELLRCYTNFKLFECIKFMFHFSFHAKNYRHLSICRYLSIIDIYLQLSIINLYLYVSIYIYIYIYIK